MKLVGTKTSPYVRKIRVILAEKNLAHEFVTIVIMAIIIGVWPPAGA